MRDLAAHLRRVWGVALAKPRDVLGVAQPGAGKTLAYLLTMAARLMGAPAATAAGVLPPPPGAAGAPGGGAAYGAGEGAAPTAGEVAAGPSAPLGLVLVPTR